MKTIKMILRFVAAALVILIAPAWWFWPPREWTHPTATNLSSYSLLLAGLLLSYHHPANIPSGPTIILFCGLWYLVSLLFGTQSGIIARLWRKRRHRA